MTPQPSATTGTADPRAIHLQTSLVVGLPPTLYTYMSPDNPAADEYPAAAAWYGLSPLLVHDLGCGAGSDEGAVGAVQHPAGWSVLLGDDAMMTVRAPLDGGGSADGPTVNLIGPMPLARSDDWCARALALGTVLLIAGPALPPGVTAVPHALAVDGQGMSAGLLRVIRVSPGGR